MPITLIAAIDRNRVIGTDNRLPWRLPDDTAFFVRMTRGKTVLMGRLTFESLPGGPLKNRTNVVLTRNPDYRPEGCEVVHSVEAALERYGRGDDELMVAGGAEIYKQTINLVDKIYLTRIFHTFEGDAFFPGLNFDEYSHQGRNGRISSRHRNFKIQ